MKIKQKILNKINNTKSRMRIALDLGVDSQAIYVLLRANSENGRLTKMDALLAISKECDIPVMDILEGQVSENVMGQ